MLGYVGCHVTSKLCGIGPAKSSWGGGKQIKDGVRSHLGGESTEKRSVIYVTAETQEVRMRQHHMEKLDATGPDATFGNDNINFDLQLEKFGVNTGILKEPAVHRIFRAWVEDWKRMPGKRMTVCQRRYCFRSIKVLSFMIPTLGMIFVFGIKTWSIIGGEEMDGSCLECVWKME